jgi:RNA polymerase sigma-70 factor (ECF subfamily)
MGTDMADAELVLKFQGGQAEAFDDLVRRYMRDAFSFCMRLTGRADEAEELSQEGFVTAYRALRGFRGEASFRSWLFRILINRWRDRRRSRRREDARMELVKADVESRGAYSGELGELDAGELGDVVKSRVQDLPDRQREVLVLHVYHGMSHHEVADVLGCSYDDVKMNLSLARKRLRETMKDYL